MSVERTTIEFDHPALADITLPAFEARGKDGPRLTLMAGVHGGEYSSIAAVITGGASGLGEATARALAKHGVKVALFDLQKDKGEKVASEIGGVFCEVNATNDESVTEGFKKARGANG